VAHRLATCPGAPHSFFDRNAEAFADASAVAWGEVVAFTGAREVADMGFLRRWLGEGERGDGREDDEPAVQDAEYLGSECAHR
jgi:hypothetical protein